MCGIAGYVGAFEAGLAARMNAAQAHRGPNGQGVFECATEEVSLGHVRLAILDLTEHASQPMHSSDERYILVFNGEIYNYADLRAELAAAGHTFTSTGDTEVLLQGLAYQGESFLDRLNGMFAFALWDRRERVLLLARDHLGIKPVYYTEPSTGTLLFASEIKALCAHSGVKREVDPAVIQEHLAYCHASGDRTALKGVKRLPPGSLLRWTAATRRAIVRQYWNPSFESRSTGNRQQEARKLQGLLETATARQLVSDVPIGAFLSGGLDSSLITALASKHVGSSFECYTITYPSEENVLDGAEEDTPYARRLAHDLGLHLREIELRPEVASLWPRLIHHLDEPLADPAAISCYLISKLARDSGTTVLLSGQGADELFCGYPRYRVMQTMRWLTLIPRPLRRVLSAGAKFLPGAREGRRGTTLRRVRRVLSSFDEDTDERFLSYCASTPEPEIDRILSQDMQDALGTCRFKDHCLEHMRSRGLRGVLRFQDRDLSLYLPNHNLLYTDKMGMAVGLEARVPFLDLELVRETARYPAKWKIVRGVTKVLLREAARGIVSDEIIDRPKAGFGAPYRKWLRYDLAPMWNDIMSESAIKRRGWFDPFALQEARRRSQAGQVDLYMLQWAALTIELWARQFIDRNPAMT